MLSALNRPVELSRLWGKVFSVASEPNTAANV